jgi:hypothetical protein
MKLTSRLLLFQVFYDDCCYGGWLNVEYLFTEYCNVKCYTECHHAGVRSTEHSLDNYDQWVIILCWVPYVACLYVKYCYFEYCYFKFFMWTIVMLSFINLCIVLLSILMLSVVMQKVIIASVILLRSSSWVTLFCASLFLVL